LSSHFTAEAGNEGVVQMIPKQFDPVFRFTMVAVFWYEGLRGMANSLKAQREDGAAQRCPDDVGAVGVEIGTAAHPCGFWRVSSALDGQAEMP
jgi:hypothetical protein